MSQCAFVAFGCRPRGLGAIRARSSGLDATGSPPVTPVASSAAHRTQLHAHANHAYTPVGRTRRRPRTDSSLSFAQQPSRSLSQTGTVQCNVVMAMRTTRTHSAPLDDDGREELSRRNHSCENFVDDSDSMKKKWLDAARRADILTLTSMVRDGFDDIGVCFPDSGTSALHIAA